MNIDFALAHVLNPLLESGLQRIVISYDVACKYNINFIQRITNPQFPLVTGEQLQRIQASTIQWLVPKFHLASHIESCADKYSFNWTKDVGRNCGENVASNWASLGGLATSIMEMGFGYRRDAITDAMLDWNWRRATGEGMYVAFNWFYSIKYSV